MSYCGGCHHASSAIGIQKHAHSRLKEKLFRSLSEEPTFVDEFGDNPDPQSVLQKFRSVFQKFFVAYERLVVP